MTDVETLEQRVRTVERALTDGDHELPAVEELAELSERVEAVETEVAELRERTDELDAATQALRGYVGNVRSVNERVEQRADTALAATERLERRLDAGEDGSRTPRTGADGDTAGRAEEQSAGPERATSPDGDCVETDRSTGASRDAGVLAQIRSLL